MRSLHHGKNRFIVAVLAYFLGPLGIHKFYLDQTAQGLVYLVTTMAALLLMLMGVSHFIAFLVLCAVGILCVIDLLRYLTQSDEAFAARFPSITDGNSHDRAIKLW